MRLIECLRVIHMSLLDISVLQSLFLDVFVTGVERRRVLYFDRERASLGRGESAA
jgi:hypothetical protein